MRSQIDMNPSRYVLLNGLPEDKDPNMKVGEIKPNDSAAYYPYYDPSKHPDQFHTPIKKKDHSQNVVYQNDKAAYYGPNPSKTIIKMNEPEGRPVKVKMGDLEKVFPSLDNIIEMTRQLGSLDKITPKSNYYYDPSNADLNKKKADLTKAIDDMKNNLKNTLKLEASLSSPIIANTTPKTPYTLVQNKLNADIEGSNKFIADNYHTAVPLYQEPKKEIEPEKSSNQSPPAPAPAENKSDTVLMSQNTNSNTPTTNTLSTNTPTLNTANSSFNASTKPDTQGMKTEKVRIVSLRKSY
jgi:hypothetical protein